MRLDPLDACRANSQACSCVRCSCRRSFRKFAVTASSRVNPRLAHLFMICSNIKLTGPAESIEIDACWRFMNGIKGIQRWTCNASWKSWRMPRNTTPPAPPRGTEKRDSSDGKGLGSTAPGMGICHSYAPDGRCISLLKVLLTNACNYDCLYCVNRTSSQRAARPLHRRRGGEADDRLLSPQLHRGPVPLLRHHPQRRLHHGAGGRASRASCARSITSAATSISRPFPRPTTR